MTDMANLTTKVLNQILLLARNMVEDFKSGENGIDQEDAVSLAKDILKLNDLLEKNNLAPDPWTIQIDSVEVLELLAEEYQFSVEKDNSGQFVLYTNLTSDDGISLRDLELKEDGS